MVIDGVRLRAKAAYLRAWGYVGISAEAPARIRRERLSICGGSPDVPRHITETEAEALPADYALCTDARDPDEWEFRVAGLLAALARRGWALGPRRPLIRMMRSTWAERHWIRRKLPSVIRSTVPMASESVKSLGSRGSPSFFH